jgi:hypothetical protein
MNIRKLLMTAVMGGTGGLASQALTASDAEAACQKVHNEENTTCPGVKSEVCLGGFVNGICGCDCETSWHPFPGGPFCKETVCDGNRSCDSGTPGGGNCSSDSG